MRSAKQSILTVDDADIILELLKLHLNDDFIVSATTSSSEALELVDSQTFDLILLDIEMPEISGIDLLKHIKKSSPNSDTPVIMLTALNEPEKIRQCLSQGAKDYILKPFNAVSVKQRILNALNK